MSVTVIGISPGGSCTTTAMRRASPLGPSGSTGPWAQGVVKHRGDQLVERHAVRTSTGRPGALASLRSRVSSGASSRAASAT